jgi:CRISPR-associated protein Cas1
MEFTHHLLMAAWHQVCRKSHTAGVDGITVDWFADRLEMELPRMQHHLEQETYLALPAKGFYLKKSTGGKRLLGIPTVRDRIVQRMLLEELYWPIEEAFLDCSYAYRPGRGIQMAVRHLYSYYQFQPSWVVKADISQFFDNLCWALLLTDLEQLKLEPIFSRFLVPRLCLGMPVSRLCLARR